VKVLRATASAVTFQLESAERRLFAEILELYPVVPDAYQPLSKSLQGAEAEADQKLLNEALTEQRAEHKRRLNVWLATKNRFRRTDVGFAFTLQRADAEWLLQVLNDIRVGSWLLLGAPEERLEYDELGPLDPELHRVWAAMELSGMFQMNLLHGLEGTAPE
jgi:hypothetical protein